MKGSPGKSTVAVAIVSVLEQLGVDRVFALPGLQIVELFDALADASFETLTPTDESSVVFMADAHARVTGRMGVAVLTAGPGLTNALTAIAEARLDSSPVLILLGGCGDLPEKSFQLHEIDQAALTAPLVKGFFKPEEPSEAVQAVLDAANLAASGEPGPSVVELSSRLLMEKSRFGTFQPGDGSYVLPDELLLNQAADFLRDAKRVGIYAGAGAVGAGAELQALAELLHAPVATTISGRGVIPEDHPLSVGYGFSRGGNLPSYRVFRKIDTLLAIGCKYGETATGCYDLKIPPRHIHIDINAASIAANYPTSLALVSDALPAIRGLLHRLSGMSRGKDPGLIRMLQKARSRQKTHEIRTVISKCHVNPSFFLMKLRDRLERDAILVTDAGEHQLWSLASFPILAARSFLTPADFQTMGFSIPAAIAAKLAAPGKQVVSLIGDGGFLLNGLECINAVRWDVDILVIVFRDGAWGLVREAQKRMYRRTPLTTIDSPDLALMARSLGMAFTQIKCDADVDRALDEVFSADGPRLVDLMVNYSETPPYAKAAGARMFGRLPLRLRLSTGGRYLCRCLSPIPGDTGGRKKKNDK